MSSAVSQAESLSVITSQSDDNDEASRVC